MTWRGVPMHPKHDRKSRELVEAAGARNVQVEALELVLLQVLVWHGIGSDAEEQVLNGAWELGADGSKVYVEAWVRPSHSERRRDIMGAHPCLVASVNVG